MNDGKEVKQNSGVEHDADRCVGGGRNDRRLWEQRVRHRHVRAGECQFGVSGGGRFCPDWHFRNVDRKRAHQQHCNAAKRHHPDMLRARGCPGRQVREASEMMSRINAAWEVICDERKL